ncbi:MAG: YppG family protein [Caldibacillus sp.]
MDTSVLYAPVSNSVNERTGKFKVWQISNHFQHSTNTILYPHSVILTWEDDTMFPGFRPPPRPPLFPSPRRHGPGHMLLHYFRGKDGSIDLDKVSKTIGTVGQIVQQIDPLIKQVKPLLKRKI